MKIIRRIAIYSATVVVAATTAVVIVPTTAQAHGAMMHPGSRTYLCWRDGLTPQGQIQPTNAACEQAVQTGGANPLYNWFGVLRSDAGGRTTGFVPDGQLCSGGNPVFSAYNAANNNWPLTHLTAGASFNWRYSNWAAHPGTWHMYVTRDGFNPNTPLKWSDLEATPFLSVTNPPQQGSVGSNDGHYYWTGNLPSGKSGRHIIYSRWVRSDSQENFFNCSDVVFDGGNGNVTGIRNSPTNPTTGPTTPVTTRPTTPVTTRPTTPPTTRPTTPVVTTPTGNSGGGACTATLRAVSSWSGGFQGEVTVRAGTSGINGWTTSFSLGGATITQLWSGQLTVGSPNVVKSLSWNADVAANTTKTYGFTTNGTLGSSPAVTCSSP